MSAIAPYSRALPVGSASKTSTGEAKRVGPSTRVMLIALLSGIVAAAAEKPVDDCEKWNNRMADLGENVKKAYAFYYGDDGSHPRAPWDVINSLDAFRTAGYFKRPEMCAMSGTVAALHLRYGDKHEGRRK